MAKLGNTEIYGKLRVGGEEYAAYPRSLRVPGTRWRLPGWSNNSRGNTSVVGGRIYYIPIFIDKLTTFDRVGLTVVTAASHTLEVRLYEWDDGMPGSLIDAPGSVSVDTTGYKSIVINWTLEPGYYFLSYRSSGNVELWGLNDGTVTSCPVSGVRGNATFLQLPILTTMASFSNPAPTPDDSLEAHFACVILREA